MTMSESLNQEEFLEYFRELQNELHHHQFVNAYILNRRFFGMSGGREQAEAAWQKALEREAYIRKHGKPWRKPTLTSEPLTKESFERFLDRLCDSCSEDC